MHATRRHTGRNCKPIQPGKIDVNGWVYMETIKVMPGLKQAREIVHDWLKSNITNFDYYP